MNDTIHVRNRLTWCPQIETVLQNAKNSTSKFQRFLLYVKKALKHAFGVFAILFYWFQTEMSLFFAMFKTIALQITKYRIIFCQETSDFKTLKISEGQINVCKQLTIITWIPCVNASLGTEWYVGKPSRSSLYGSNRWTWSCWVMHDNDHSIVPIHKLLAGTSCENLWFYKPSVNTTDIDFSFLEEAWLFYYPVMRDIITYSKVFLMSERISESGFGF